MSRYKVGEKVLITFFELQGRNAQPMVGNVLVPWRDRLILAHMLELTITEHVKVPNGHDPKEEPTCDGFIARDKYGRTWHNQYPDASYGQLSTDADYYFSMADGREYRGRTDSLDIFEDVTQSIDRMSRGLHELQKMADDLLLPQEQRTNMFVKNGLVKDREEVLHNRGLLQRQIDWLCKKIGKDFDYHVDIKPYVARYTNGKPPEEFPDIQISKLVPKQVQRDQIKRDYMRIA